VKEKIKQDYPNQAVSINKEDWDMDLSDKLIQTLEIYMEKE
jgi:hypothetical protein